MDAATINWPIIVLIAGLGILLGLALTLRRQVVSGRDVREIVEGMQDADQSQIVEERERPFRLKVPFFSKEEEDESLGYRLAKSEMKLQRFLNPDEMKSVYDKYKKRFALVGVAIALPIAGFAFVKGQQLGLLAIPIGVLLGWSIPLFMMNSKRAAMEQEVIDLIPDLLGYLSAFVTPEAELVGPIKMILRNDEEHADNILYASIREALKELKVGGNFYESLTQQANILGVDEWKSVVFTLNQARQVADRNLVEIIREVESDFREERKLRLEMAASKVTTKLSTISSLLLVPSIYTYTMAPAYMQLFSTPGFM